MILRCTIKTYQMFTIIISGRGIIGNYFSVVFCNFMISVLSMSHVCRKKK